MLISLTGTKGEHIQISESGHQELWICVTTAEGKVHAEISPREYARLMAALSSDWFARQTFERTSHEEN